MTADRKCKSSSCTLVLLHSHWPIWIMLHSAMSLLIRRCSAFNLLEDADTCAEACSDADVTKAEECRAWDSCMPATHVHVCWHISVAGEVHFRVGLGSMLSCFRALSLMKWLRVVMWAHGPTSWSKPNCQALDACGRRTLDSQACAHVAKWTR